MYVCIIVIIISSSSSLSGWAGARPLGPAAAEERGRRLLAVLRRELSLTCA